MRTAYLLIGGNLGNRKENLAKAVSLINEQCGSLTRSSSIYETEAWGNTDQPSFLNQALEISTSLTARLLMRRVLRIEEEMGRIRKEKLGPRRDQFQLATPCFKKDNSGTVGRMS